MPPRKRRGRKKATSVSKKATRTNSSHGTSDATQDTLKYGEKKIEEAAETPKMTKDIKELEEERKDAKSEKHGQSLPVTTDATIESNVKSIDSKKVVPSNVLSKEKEKDVFAETEADDIMKIVNETNDKKRSIMSPIKSLQMSPLKNIIKGDTKDLKPDAGSPIKRRKLDPSPERNVDRDTKSMEMHVGLLFQKKDLKGLTAISQKTSRRSAQTFENYKKLVDRRAKTAEIIIANLTKENKTLKNTVKGLRTENRHSTNAVDSKEINKWKTKEVETRKKLDKLEEAKNSMESKLSDANNELVLSDSKQEMIELLCGTACLDYEENEKSIIFALRQSGTLCTLYYQLIINKSEPSDLIYSPVQKKPQDWPTDSAISWKVNMDRLHSLLPEYLLDNLTFPSSNLRNFYRKISKAVNGTGKQKEAA